MSGVQPGSEWWRWVVVVSGGDERTTEHEPERTEYKSAREQERTSSLERTRENKFS